jgi:hypothetical protein
VDGYKEMVRNKENLSWNHLVSSRITSSGVSVNHRNHCLLNDGWPQDFTASNEMRHFEHPSHTLLLFSLLPILPVLLIPTQKMVGQKCASETHSPKSSWLIRYSELHSGICLLYITPHVYPRLKWDVF